MKAEHRKELQTNTLADGMGRLVQRIKTRPEKGSGWYWVLLFLVVVAVGIGYLYLRGSWQQQSSNLWFKVDHLNANSLEEINAAYANTNPGISARYQVAWLSLSYTLRNLPVTNPAETAQGLKALQDRYRLLGEEVKANNPTLAAESAYCMALAEEAMAVNDADGSLNEAVKKYRAVVNDYPNTARAKQAGERLSQLENQHSRAQILDFYEKLGSAVKMQFPARDFEEQMKKLQQQHKK